MSVSATGERAVAWRALLTEATNRLAAVTDTPYVDARRIVERASDSSGPDLLLALDRAVTVREVAFFDRMVERRLAGEPLQYVLGSWGFRTLDLYLDRRVLIPRPETEVVAGHAMRELDRALAARSAGAGRLADLGTGSGAIALAVAVERTNVEVWATDLSADALDVARANLAGIGRPARRVQLVLGDWYAALPSELKGELDVIVSNPPYVAADDDLPDDVRDWEPRLALVSGPTGLESYEVIVAGARAWLRPGGSLVLELGSTQARPVRELARAARFQAIEIHPDLAGRDRVLVAR